MDAFKIHRELIADYRHFTEGFVNPADERISAKLAQESAQGRQWPDPWLSLNPSFETGGSVDELVAAGILHPDTAQIFRVKHNIDDQGASPIVFHKHQRDAIEVAATGKNYVLTTGTGSGKSLAYIVPIVDRILREGSGQGTKAIVVYPMNALANSQLEELRKFLEFGFGGQAPVTFRRYTGQESRDERQEILDSPPDILLTNYVMLDLVMTRPDERRSLISAARGLQFLVLDELHTYRGRQGADVGMLVRRLREACEAEQTLQCVGTSATMSSGGTLTQQREDVAAVATQIFGATVSPDAVITETLVRASSGTAHDSATLKALVGERGPTEAAQLHLSADELATDPLAGWIEDTFGLRTEPESQALVRQRPETVQQAAKALAELTDTDPTTAANAIRATLLAGSEAKTTIGRSFFAFRLHQFLSKGSNAYVTPEAPATRAITTEFQVVLPGDPERRLYPLAFCRECGQEYLVARREYPMRAGASFARHQIRIADRSDGYLFISRDHPWPADPLGEGRLPSSWVVETAAGTAINKNRTGDVPEQVDITPDGTITPLTPSEGAEHQLAAWIPGTFRFCLACGVSYEAIRTSEYTKLATLDREGRSSAMTVLATSLLTQLKSLDDTELPRRARKLLTFVDNRQDAALQAGHLNDFVQVAQLRGALHRAAQAAGEQGLDALDIGGCVADALKLSPLDYLADPEGLNTRAATRALRKVIEYRSLVDLQRGWRVTLPNLEQTGLVVVDYPLAHELAKRDDRWQDADFRLAAASHGQRFEIIKVLLDEFRRVLAIDAEALTPEWFERLQRESREYLTGLWGIGEYEAMATVGIAVPQSGVKGGPRSLLTLTGLGAFGKWLRARERFGVSLNPADADLVIASLLSVLDRAGIVTKVADSYVSGYRLKSSAIVLYAGDGTTGAADPLRRRFQNEQKPRVVEFFRDLYRDNSSELAGLHAAEHTAQVPAEVRMQREEEFTEAKLPLLFCSPTMELGVDIAELNAVGMRNVPPTPANYAQRSGRAGRSGQPAIVMTYCASGNAHDTYYFERSALMVAGQVQPPRLDLANEDLIRSHVHAIWLAEILAASHNGLGKSMSEVLDLNNVEQRYPIKRSLHDKLRDESAKSRAQASATEVLSELLGTLHVASWWSDQWVSTVINDAPNALDRACDRWRDLYSSAQVEAEIAFHQSQNHSSSRKERDDALRRQREATQRMNLLLNDTSGSRDSGYTQSDFYTYRYLASEGFLPGYSFPRLPLAAFIPGANGRSGNWLQRPRFLAISEFGPQSLIYHEGARYQVTRIALPRGGEGDTDVLLTAAKVCGSCGAHHANTKGVDVCDNCGEPLPVEERDLLPLQTVMTRRRERISSDEEERNRVGYELRTTYQFVPRADHPGKVGAHALTDASDEVLEVTYGDAAEVRITNLGRLRRKNPDAHGFWLDTVKGRWLSEKDVKEMDAAAAGSDDDTPLAEDVKTKAFVTPYVEDRRNIAILRWSRALSEIESTTARYAIERGIEARFQLEDTELASEALPDKDQRGRILLTEAAEGGAGVLRRLQSDPTALADVATEALRIMHVDPATGKDENNACVRGCYRCLLSYSNQIEHEKIDRREAIGLLRELAQTTVHPDAIVPVAPPVAPSPETSDSAPSVDIVEAGTRAEAFLNFLSARGFRPPTTADEEVDGILVDFLYDAPPAAVVVHDDVVHVDASELEFLGYHVITIHQDDDFESIVQAHPRVFIEGAA